MSDNVRDQENPEDNEKDIPSDLENSNHQNEIGILRKKINDLESKNRTLRKKLEEINASNLQSQIINCKQKISKLESEKKTLLERSKEFEAKQEYIGFLEKEITRMENTIDNLQTSIHDLEVEKKIVSKSFEDSEMQIDVEEEQSSEIRRTCPECGNNIPSQIREMTDKTNIISNYPKIYGKKYQCGQCGTEWR